MSGPPAVVTVHVLAPFRLVGRPRLEHAVVAPFARLRDALADASPGWAGVQGQVTRAPAGDGVVIADHEVSADAVLPRTLWEGTLADRSALPPEVATVTAVVGPHGVGAVVARLELRPGDGLEDVEQALTRGLARPVQDLAEAHSRVLTGFRLLGVEDPGGRDLPQGSLLWWHRLLDPRLQQAADRLCQLEGSAQVDLRAGVVLQVADGYSCLSGGDDDDRRAVLQGLLQATELWLVSDRLQRRLSESTASLLRGDEGDLADVQAKALVLSESSELQGQLLAEQLRYTTGAALLTLETAARGWRTPVDLAPLIARAGQLEAAVARRVEERRAEQDRKAGRLLTGIAVISALAVLLSVFETAVGGAPDYGQPVRLVFAAAVLLVSAAVVGRALLPARGRRRAGRARGAATPPASTRASAG